MSACHVFQPSEDRIKVPELPTVIASSESICSIAESLPQWFFFFFPVLRFYEYVLLEEMNKGLKELRLEGQIPVDQLFAHAKQCQAEVEQKLDAKMPKFHRNYWWNSTENMKVQMKPTRLGFGQSLAANGDDPRVVCFGLDISGSITISEFYAKNPERKDRWISMGIAEQSATSAAAGLAKEGKLPVFGTYATFAAARNLDQIRTSICYGNFNVLIAGAHGGVSVDPMAPHTKRSKTASPCADCPT